MIPDTDPPDPSNPPDRLRPLMDWHTAVYPWSVIGPEFRRQVAEIVAGRKPPLSTPLKRIFQDRPHYAKPKGPHEG